MDAFKLTSFFQSYPNIRQIIIGYSGGLDSTVLLHAIANNPAIQKNFLIKAIHINHNLSEHADNWAQHCKRFAAQLNIPYKAENIFIDLGSKLSLEEQARGKRYQALAHYLTEESALVTAHHQDDQAETMLLQLMRGTGVAGLSAMPICKKLGSGLQLRPFLDIPRAQLMTYANEYQLSWIDDESNFDTGLDRNYLRHEVMPKLHIRWPQVAKLMSRAAQHVAEASELTQLLAKQDLAKVIDDNTIKLDDLVALEPSRQKNLIRFWLKENDNIILEEKQLNEILSSVIGASQDATPCFKMNDYEIRRFKQRLYVIKALQSIDCAWEAQWSLADNLTLPFELGILKREIYSEFSDEAPLTVCFRQLGMRVVLKNRTGHHKLKHLMQEWQVPPWERASLPLVLSGERLVSAGKYYFEGETCEQHHFV